MPSKALIEAANAFHRCGAFEEFGIRGGEASIATGRADFSKLARARMAQTAAGILRIHADRNSGRLMAAEMCVPGAEHLAPNIWSICWHSR